MNKEIAQLKIKGVALAAISKMFYCLYYVDIKNNTVMELHTDVKKVHDAIGNFGDANNIIDVFCNKLVLPSYKERLLEFTDFSTLSQRIEGKTYISCDYEGIYSGWSEAIFIEVDKSEDGMISHALFLVRNISESKKKELEITKSLINSYEVTKAELDFEKMAISSIQKSIKSGFWSLVLDKNFKTIKCSWSDSFRKMLGYQKDDNIPDMANFFKDIVYEDDKAAMTKEILINLTSEFDENSYDTEYRLRTKSGENRWYRSIGRVSHREDTYVIFGLIYDINEKKKSELLFSEEIKRREEQALVLKSMADSYLSMHMIDLNNNICIEYNSNHYISEWTSRYSDAVSMMRAAMINTTTDEYREIMLNFTDLKTLSQRMKNSKQISCEFIGVNFGWVKAEFTVVSRNKDGSAEKVIFTTIVIDDEKKREEKLLIESCTDALTQLGNRKAYENDLRKYNIRKNIGFVSFDLNGLKSTNDTYGHFIGDELICGAARCIRQIYGPYGKLYRIGGDEFTAIIDTEHFEELAQEFEKICLEWKCKISKDIKLRVSLGSASRKEYPDASILELSRIADRKMYESKALYYRNSGIDRRKR